MGPFSPLRRTRSFQLHPDGSHFNPAKPGSTTEQFMQVKAAFDVLRNEEKRRSYDYALDRGGGEGPRAQATRGVIASHAEFTCPLQRRPSTSRSQQEVILTRPTRPRARPSFIVEELNIGPQRGHFYNPTTRHAADRRFKRNLAIFALAVVGIHYGVLW
jgi:curved DNA-binding protein CbpA